MLIVSVDENQVLLMAGVTDDLAERFPAAELIKTIAPLVHGRGGGRASLAQGSGKHVAGAAGLADAAAGWLAGRAG